MKILPCKIFYLYSINFEWIGKGTVNGSELFSVVSCQCSVRQRNVLGGIRCWLLVVGCWLALYGADYLGNGPAMMGPESTGFQACLQWAHCTSRVAALLAPEWVSTATEFFFWQ